MIKKTILTVVAWACFTLAFGGCYRMEDAGMWLPPVDDGSTDLDGDTDSDIDSDADGDSDSDTDTDTDTDSDTDADTDSETDTGTGSDTDSDADVDSDTDGGSDTDMADCPELNPGDIFLMEPSSSMPDKFIMNAETQVMYFPDYTAAGDDNTVFFSWRASTDGLPLISQDCFDTLAVPSDYPAGVNLRPGSFVIKRPGLDQLYVVLPNNTKAEITPEAAAVLYGTPAFEDGVDDSFQAVPDTFWPNLVNTAPAITDALVHPGMIFKVEGESDIYYADPDGTIREISAIGFNMNFFQLRFVRQVPSSAVAGLTVGEPIGGFIPEISDPTQGG